MFDEVVQDRIDREGRDGLDAGLADDVLAVGDDGVHGDVEGIGYLVVLETFGEADENILFAIGEGVGVGFVAVRLEGTDHLVKGRFDALEVVVEFDDAGELSLVLRFDVGGDEPDDAQVRQLVKFGAEGGPFGIVEQQRIDNQDIWMQGVDSRIEGVEVVGGEDDLRVRQLP